jgi:hypothetical protein
MLFTFERSVWRAIRLPQNITVLVDARLAEFYLSWADIRWTSTAATEESWWLVP